MLHRLAVLTRTVSSRPAATMSQSRADWLSTAIVPVVDAVIAGFDVPFVPHLLHQTGEDGVLSRWGRVISGSTDRESRPWAIRTKAARCDGP